MKNEEKKVYSEEDILAEIEKLRIQVDFMEELMNIYEEQEYENQNFFNARLTMEKQVAPLSFKGRVVRKVYRLIKYILDKLGITSWFKKTRLYAYLEEREIIFKIANGQL